ncbi:DNA-directed RNA polymerase [Methanopyrus kandleri]|uniref:DNA-directed RNA polymerase subunit Rpo7 n=2 Tax=Methanopyrus kandleri TaxID=2320 RepID=Q8TVE1_METKA|nr:DNA-directed RNA polymerase [Methanopyrus kandleri]AAM02664.1 DNA-directed RNA polymerase subunit E' [Methanopyrus kandleri AV19]HII70920.1 DNA-directed RNA polymerase [Methanopyrus kandleri]
MYELVELETTVRIPPTQFTSDVEDAVLKALENDVEGKLFREDDTGEPIGFVVFVDEILDVENEGIFPGDGASYHRVRFRALVFRPVEREVVVGEVTRVKEYGAFVRLGPLDGLLHVSQILDEYMYYDGAREALVGEETGRELKRGDVIKVMIIGVSLNEERPRDSKIALTVKRPGLGKPEWWE